MASLNHYIFNLKNIASGGIASDDFSISEEQIKFWFNEYRALLIRQELSERATISDSYTQTIVVEFAKVDVVEHCELSSDCFVLKSTKPIPKTIRRNSANSILSVKSLDERLTFSETNTSRKVFNKYNKYTPNAVRWYIKDDYIYIINNTKIQYARLTVILEDPSEAYNFQCAKNVSCYPNDDAEYPISLDMASRITDIIIKSRLQPMGYALKRDTANDGVNNTQVPQNK